MAHRMMFVNLPVRDLDRAKAFFGNLGFSFNARFTDDKAAYMVVSEVGYVMLIQEAFYRTFTKRELCDTTRQIVPHLWFAEKALEAARFYVSLFPESRVDSVTPIPADTPSGPAGSVHVVEFTLAGQQFMAIDAAPLDPFNHAISFLVNCADQAEVDRLWSAGVGRGLSADRCDWQS